MSEFGPKHNWKCTRAGCKGDISAWTEGGLRVQKEFHLEAHVREDRENMVKFDQALKAAPEKDYAKLRINWFDMNILNRAKISFDADMEYTKEFDRGSKR